MRNRNVLFYAGGGGSGGYVRYCRGLLSSGSLQGESEIWLLCSPSFLAQIGPVDTGIHLICHEWISSPSRLKRILWHFFHYPKLLLRLRPDVEFYASGYISPVRRLFKGRVKVATVCHNLLPFYKGTDNNGDEYGAMKLQWRDHIKSLSQADGVIFLSKYSQKLVSQKLPGLGNSVVIGHGIEPYFRASADRNFSLGRIIKILYISPIFPYKHQAEVVDAVQLVANKNGLDVQIALVGGGESRFLNTLTDHIKKQKAMANVSVKGFMDSSALIDEYKIKLLSKLRK